MNKEQKIVIFSHNCNTFTSTFYFKMYLFENYDFIGVNFDLQKFKTLLTNNVICHIGPRQRFRPTVQIREFEFEILTIVVLYFHP